VLFGKSKYVFRILAAVLCALNFNCADANDIQWYSEAPRTSVDIMRLHDINGSDPVRLKGENLQANIDSAADKTVNVNADIYSDSKTNTLSLTGEGEIVFNGVVDPVTITNTNKVTVHNDYLDDVIYNLNGGLVTVANDKYLNGIDNKNILNFNGGTLNIANGSIGNISLAEMNINRNSNIALDADLQNEKMDRITADKYTASANASLSVVAIRLLNDSYKNTTVINAVDPNIKTESGETLASKVDSKVSSTAYSPLFKYTVSYNKTNGNFTFTRGATAYFDSLNPVLGSEAVATQVGGYLGMLETYNNAFANMDFHMMQNANLRNGKKLANSYAVSDSADLRYFSGSSNSGGVYFRPYTSYDSIRLHGGPSVRSTSYMAFIGGDTEMHQTKRGWVWGISPHIAYLGSHQKYSINNIYQNGASLGLTSMFYKKNFFTGFTIAGNVSVANSENSFRKDDFPVVALGIANKTGYNIESKKGRFVIQPSLLLSYTHVNTFDDYTKVAGLELKTSALNAMQIQPALKFIVNTKKDWHPYAFVDMNMFLGGYALPQMSIDPYIQYGIGIQKTIPDVITCYLQILARNMGRNGFAATGGLKWYIYKDSKKKAVRSNTV